MAEKTINNVLYLLMARGKISKQRGETALSILVADTLRGYTIDGRLKAVWCKIPNESKRSPLAGSILKAMGMIPGAFDFVFTWDGGSGWIELKNPEDKSSNFNENQRNFSAWCMHRDVQHALCRSVDEVIHTLKKWGAFV